MTKEDLMKAISDKYEYTKAYDNDSLSDGVWDITNIPYCMIGRYELKQNIDTNDFDIFVAMYPDFILAHPYETDMFVLLARRPEKITTCVGTGFNYGSCNIIENCPQTVLICAEDD